MSMSTNRDNFFQSSATLDSQERRAKKASNTEGNPINIGSKILDILPDPLNPDRIYIAESTGLARRISLESGEKGKHVYRSHTAPCTCLALDQTGRILFTGSWDRTIIMWNTETREPLLTFLGHSDFIKCLSYIPSVPTGFLLSGSADKSIIVWEVTSGARFQTLLGHKGAVQDVVVDPLSDPTSFYELYSAGSEPDIRHWRLNIEGCSAEEVPEKSIKDHETSVYRIRFTGEDFDMWTASADKSARRIDRHSGKSDMVLPHPDFVNDVLVDSSGRWVITACRDEEVRVWDSASGQLHHVFEGHFEEVTKLALVGSTVVSASIDGTIRTWSIEPKELQKFVEKKKLEGTPQELKMEEDPAVKKGGTQLTEEEERELLELMED